VRDKTLRGTANKKGGGPEKGPPPQRRRNASTLLLHFKLGLSRSALGHIHFGFHLAGEGMPRKDFMLTGRYILNFKGAIFLGDGIVRIPDREIETLHELMLIALQASVGRLCVTGVIAPITPNGA